MATQIVVADDHKIMRDGLRTLFEKEPGMDVIAEAGTGREAVHLARKLNPQVVLMDVSMADLNGIEATRLIKKICPQTKVIALSIHSDKRFIMGMFRAGASGYILKDCAFSELVQAVKAVLQEKTYLCSKISEVMLRDLLEAEPGEAGAQALTPREREILQLLAEGKTTKVIASLLHLSQKTIETHRQHIMEKLNIFSIAELTKFAVREGITPP